MATNEISPEQTIDDYYSLLDLIDKLGKEGVAEMVAKGKPHRITQGDMIYFLKADVHRIIGDDLSDEESVGLIVDDLVEDLVDICSQITFKQSLIKRHKMGQEEEIYQNIPLDLSEEVVYGRNRGELQTREALHSCGIISSLHGKLFLDEDDNLLYENVGANKSKVRGCKDKNYSVLGPDDIAVLIPREVFEDLLHHPHYVSTSIKLGYQLKPHFIIRIVATKA